MARQLLDRFRALFEGQPYLHRDSTRGDWVAQALPDDLLDLGLSEKLVDRIKIKSRVLNIQNTRRGIVSRRGDGSFGEIIPGTTAISSGDSHVARGQVATIEIGTEVKILAKAMIKQIDRVMGSLKDQVVHFKRGGDAPICVAIVGVNHADFTVSYEGEREWPTDGRKHKHPSQEAIEARRRIEKEVRSHYDELLFLPYKATNASPFPFDWVNESETEMDYAAILTRISRQYDRRF